MRKLAEYRGSSIIINSKKGGGKIGHRNTLAEPFMLGSRWFDY